MKRAILLVALAACGSRTPTATLPAQPSASPPAPISSAPPPAADTHALRRVERKASVEALKTTKIPWDVQLRGEHDDALERAIQSATAAWSYPSLTMSPRGDRILVSGETRSGQSTFALLDATGQRLRAQAGDNPIFTSDGEVLYRVGTQLFILDATPRAIGGPESALCVESSCKKRSVMIAATAGASKVLVSQIGRGFVHDEDVFVLDPRTGSTNAVFAPSPDAAFLAGGLFASGQFCAYQMAYSHGDGVPTPATLECATPPWSDVKKLFVSTGGAGNLGDVGGRVVTGDSSTLHVFDATLTKHATYALPEGGGLPIALTDGRSVAIEGRDRILLVDVVDETYAVLTGVPTVVMPLVGHVKAFVATGDGTASIVRYE